MPIDNELVEVASIYCFTNSLIQRVLSLTNAQRSVGSTDCEYRWLGPAGTALPVSGLTVGDLIVMLLAHDSPDVVVGVPGEFGILALGIVDVPNEHTGYELFVSAPAEVVDDGVAVCSDRYSG